MLYTVLWCRMDSRVPEGAVYDLILAINAIQTGQCSDPAACSAACETPAKLGVSRATSSMIWELSV